MYSYVAVAAKGGAGGDSVILKKFLMPMYYCIKTSHAHMPNSRKVAEGIFSPPRCREMRKWCRQWHQLPSLLARR